MQPGRTGRGADRVFLTGFMAAGKTAVGKALAKTMGYRFIDLDHKVEAHAGASVRQIFEQKGEAAFRDLEHQALADTERETGLVVATGGGTVTFERNRALIRRLGTSVWLRPSFETLLARLDGRGARKRPLFQGAEQARKLYRERLDDYRQADIKVDIGASETAEAVAARIQPLL